MNQMRVLSPEDGDKLIEWDPSDEKSVEKAKKQFQRLLDKGHKAYRAIRTPQRTGTPITEFDPSAGEIVLVPAMAGG